MNKLPHIAVITAAAIFATGATCPTTIPLPLPETCATTFFDSELGVGVTPPFGWTPRPELTVDTRTFFEWERTRTTATPTANFQLTVDTETTHATAEDLTQDGLPALITNFQAVPTLNEATVTASGADAWILIVESDDIFMVLLVRVEGNAHYVSRVNVFGTISPVERAEFIEDVKTLCVQSEM